MSITWEEAADSGCIECILCDARGVYIPRDFCDGFEGWDGIDDDDRQTCLNGPDDEWYWEAWQNILDNASYTDPTTGHVWRLYQDGDVFVIRDDIEIDWDSAF